MRQFLRILARFAASRMRMSCAPFILYRLIRRQYIVTALNYHRIVDSRLTESFYTDYDRGLDASIFGIQLDSLARHFRFVDLGEFLDIVTGRRLPTTHTALLTFDDADSDFTEYALPVLTRRNIPAVMMAPASLIGSTKQLWHVRVSNAMRSATDDHWDEIRRRTDEWPAPVAEIVRNTGKLAPEADRRPISRAINLALDLVPHEDVDQLVEQWERIIVPEGLLPIRCMDWSELRNLEQHRIAVESHTLTHRKLTMLSDEELACELEQSRLILESKLDKKVRVVAYPQGRYEERVGKAACAAGYEAAFTTVRTPTRYPLSGNDLYAIPRLDVPGVTRGDVDLHFTQVASRWLRQTKP